MSPKISLRRDSKSILFKNINIFQFNWDDPAWFPSTSTSSSTTPILLSTSKTSYLLQLLKHLQMHLLQLLSLKHQPSFNLQLPSLQHQPSFNLQLPSLLPIFALAPQFLPAMSFQIQTFFKCNGIRWSLFFNLHHYLQS